MGEKIVFNKPEITDLRYVCCSDDLPLRGPQEYAFLLFTCQICVKWKYFHLLSRATFMNGTDTLANFLYTGQKNQNGATLWIRPDNMINYGGNKLQVG